jgi:hypothetical protein
MYIQLPNSLNHPGPLWIRNLFIRYMIKVVSSNHVHGEVYSIQHYVINFSQWVVTGRWFSPGTPVSSSNKTDSHNKTEILLKVALNTIYQPYCLWIRNLYFKFVLVVYEWKKIKIFSFLLNEELRLQATTQLYLFQITQIKLNIYGTNCDPIGDLSEWLLLNATWTIFQLYQVHVDRTRSKCLI